MKYLIFIFLSISACSGEALLVGGEQITVEWNGRYQELTGTGIDLMEVGTKQVRIATIKDIISPNLYELDSIISQNPN